MSDLADAERLAREWANPTTGDARAVQPWAVQLLLINYDRRGAELSVARRRIDEIERDLADAQSIVSTQGSGSWKLGGRQ